VFCCAVSLREIRSVAVQLLPIYSRHCDRIPLGMHHNDRTSTNAFHSHTLPLDPQDWRGELAVDYTRLVLNGIVPSEMYTAMKATGMLAGANEMRRVGYIPSRYSRARPSIDMQPELRQDRHRKNGPFAQSSTLSGSLLRPHKKSPLSRVLSPSNTPRHRISESPCPYSTLRIGTALIPLVCTNVDADALLATFLVD
jgi:hypothetical protein